LFPPNEDTTANGLMHHGYMEVSIDSVAPGCLVFWGDGTARHVEMVYAVTTDGQAFTIGASGGGSGTTSMADAIAQNAYIKIRPLRVDVIAACDPFAALRPGGVNGDF
jgi:hypothetical protein